MRRVEPPDADPDEPDVTGGPEPYNPVYLASLQAAPSKSSRSSRAVAWLMDEMISIPGTKIKFGLDPLIGVFSAIGVPVGDVVANMVSSVMLVEAIRKGLPFRSTVRILGNILLNAGVGSVPVAGDFFSFLFRSNSRNRDLIESHLAAQDLTGNKPSWWRVAGSLFALVLALLLAVLVCLAVSSLVAGQIWRLLGRNVETIFG